MAHLYPSLVFYLWPCLLYILSFVGHTYGHSCALSHLILRKILINNTPIVWMGRLLFREFKLFFHGDSEQRLLLLTSWSLWSRGIYFAPTRIYSSIPLSPLTPQEQTHLEFSFDTHEKINQAFFSLFNYFFYPAKF